MKKNVKNILLVFLAIALVLISYIKIDSNVSEKDEYKIFLNKVLQVDSKALEYGYNFLSKYPLSQYTDDVLFYLSFIEDDYFKNLINLKKLILYYPDSKWFEFAVVRLLNFLYIHGNYSEVFKWYKFYNVKSKKKDLDYEIEIIYLNTLYHNNKRYKKDLKPLKEKLINNFSNINNKKLLSFSLYLYSYILYKEDNNPIKAYQYFLKLYSMFYDTDYYQNTLYFLYKIGMGQDKVFFAKKLINTPIFQFLKEKDEILTYSKRSVRSEVQKVIDKKFLRDYYFISIGVSKDIDENIKNIVTKNGFNFYKQKLDNVYRFGVGPYHFYDDAKADLQKLKSIGINGKIVEIEYNK